MPGKEYTLPIAVGDLLENNLTGETFLIATEEDKQRLVEKMLIESLNRKSHNCCKYLNPGAGLGKWRVVSKNQTDSVDTNTPYSEFPSDFVIQLEGNAKTCLKCSTEQKDTERSKNDNSSSMFKKVNHQITEKIDRCTNDKIVRPNPTYQGASEVPLNNNRVMEPSQDDEEKTKFHSITASVSGKLKHHTPRIKMPTEKAHKEYIKVPTREMKGGNQGQKRPKCIFQSLPSKKPGPTHCMLSSPNEDCFILSPSSCKENFKTIEKCLSDLKMIGEVVASKFKSMLVTCRYFEVVICVAHCIFRFLNVLKSCIDSHNVEGLEASDVVSWVLMAIYGVFERTKGALKVTKGWVTVQKEILGVIGDTLKSVHDLVLVKLFAVPSQVHIDLESLLYARVCPLPQLPFLRKKRVSLLKLFLDLQQQKCSEEEPFDEIFVSHTARERYIWNISRYIPMEVIYIIKWKPDIGHQYPDVIESDAILAIDLLKNDADGTGLISGEVNSNEVIEKTSDRNIPKSSVNSELNSKNVTENNEKSVKEDNVSSQMAGTVKETESNDGNQQNKIKPVSCIDETDIMELQMNVKQGLTVEKQSVSRKRKIISEREACSVKKKLATFKTHSLQPQKCDIFPQVIQAKSSPSAIPQPVIKTIQNTDQQPKINTCPGTSQQLASTPSDSMKKQTSTNTVVVIPTQSNIDTRVSNIQYPTIKTAAGTVQQTVVNTSKGTKLPLAPNTSQQTGTNYLKSQQTGTNNLKSIFLQPVFIGFPSLNQQQMVKTNSLINQQTVTKIMQSVNQQPKTQMLNGKVMLQPVRELFKNRLQAVTNTVQKNKVNSSTSANQFSSSSTLQTTCFKLSVINTANTASSQLSSVSETNRQSDDQQPRTQTSNDKVNQQNVKTLLVTNQPAVANTVQKTNQDSKDVSLVSANQVLLINALQTPCSKQTVTNSTNAARSQCLYVGQTNTFYLVPLQSGSESSKQNSTGKRNIVNIMAPVNVRPEKTQFARIASGTNHLQLKNNQSLTLSSHSKESSNGCVGSANRCTLSPSESRGNWPTGKDDLKINCEEMFKDPDKPKPIPTRLKSNSHVSVPPLHVKTNHTESVACGEKDNKKMTVLTDTMIEDQLKVQSADIILEPAREKNWTLVQTKIKEDTAQPCSDGMLSPVVSVSAIKSIHNSSNYENAHDGYEANSGQAGVHVPVSLFPNLASNQNAIDTLESGKCRLNEERLVFLPLSEGQDFQFTPVLINPVKNTSVSTNSSACSVVQSGPQTISTTRVRNKGDKAASSEKVLHDSEVCVQVTYSEVDMKVRAAKTSFQDAVNNLTFENQRGNWTKLLLTRLLSSNDWDYKMSSVGDLCRVCKICGAAENSAEAQLRHAVNHKYMCRICRREFSHINLFSSHFGLCDHGFKHFTPDITVFKNDSSLCSASGRRGKHHQTKFCEIISSGQEKGGSYLLKCRYHKDFHNSADKGAPFQCVNCKEVFMYRNTMYFHYIQAVKCGQKALALDLQSKNYVRRCRKTEKTSVLRKIMLQQLKRKRRDLLTAKLKAQTKVLTYK